MLTSIMAAVAAVLPELAKAASGMMRKTIPVGINKAKQMHPFLLFQKIRMHLFLLFIGRTNTEGLRVGISIYLF
jgi:hypothetical protein